MTDTENITLSETVETITLNDLSTLETIVFTEQVPEQIVFSEVGEKGDKGDAGEGINNFDGDPVAFYLLAKGS